MPAYRSVTIRDHSTPVHRAYLTAPWKRSWRTLGAAEATGLDYAEVRSAQALGLLILRAQRREQEVTNHAIDTALHPVGWYRVDTSCPA